MKSIVVLAAMLIGMPSSFAESKLTAEQAENGKPIYEKLCIGCHGERGKGDGAAANFLRPRPRNFKIARYKFTYTMYGKLPKDSTIFNAIAVGLPGTSMPGWEDTLTDDQIWDVVAYIKTLSRKFTRAEKKKRYPKPIEIVDVPKEWTGEDIKQGYELFKKNCVKCHGVTGLGSGSTAVALKHDLGDRIWPRNLTRGWVYRGGNEPKDIFRTIATGITGTPMPAHLETMKPEDIWKIVGFVNSIVKREPPRVSEVIISRYVEGGLPKRPTDKKWDELPLEYIPLVSQIVEGNRWFTTTLESIYVRSFYNNDYISILVEYDDPSQSPLETPIEMFPENEPDSFAIQLPTIIPTGMEKPYFLNGDDDAPVNLWKWTNNTNGNGADALLGKGITNAVLMDESSQNITVKSVYDNGRWKIMFTRKLKVGQESNLDFEVGKYIPIAFNAWDGNNGEKNEQRAISIWYWLLLDSPSSMNVYLFPLIIGLMIAGGEVWLIFKAKKG